MLGTTTVDAATPVSTRRRGVLFATVLVAYLVLGVFFAWTLANHDYESEYLVLGDLVVRGEISLYQDEMRGQWVPLPFYAYGVAQILLGRSLFAARLLSVGVGAIVLGLVFVLADRWRGPLAAATACALVVTHGLVTGYLSTVHFAGVTAALHLLGIYILFGTDGPRRDVLGMLVVSVLFLVKPNYWPTVAFVWFFLVWRAPSLRRRVALTAAAAAIPVVFFASDPEHVKIFAYVPVLRDWVASLGYHPWYALTEDAAEVAASDYVTLPWETSFFGRAEPILEAFMFFLKRYAAWMTLLAGGLVLAAVRPGAARRALWDPPGLRFTFWLFWAVVLVQFLILGPYAKQAVAFAGPVAPLLAVALGCLFATVVRTTSKGVRAAAIAAMTVVLLASPWLHRHHNLPRRVSLAEAEIPGLAKQARAIATLLPPTEARVFSMADPMLLYLAGRRAYLQQFNQHKFVFTSLADRMRYHRVGMWGPTELEEWLAGDARYAVLQAEVVDFYRRRERYRPILARMDALLAERFTLIGEVAGDAADRILVYRRHGL